MKLFQVLLRVDLELYPLFEIEIRTLRHRLSFVGSSVARSILTFKRFAKSVPMGSRPMLTRNFLVNIYFQTVLLGFQEN